MLLYNSTNKYSFSEAVSLVKFQPTEINFEGYGYEDKGNWVSGNLRIEYWYDGKCIGSKTFKL